jgi:menaquinol-cytochrome c reductase iron-sulfur subunit
MSEITRRNFFGRVIAMIAGFVALGLSIPFLGYLILPAFRKREESWSEVGLMEQLEVNQPKEFNVVRNLTDGWMTTKSVRAVWAFRKPNGGAVVYSPNCPHLGCGYRWDEEKKEFLCPCHGSIFDLNGTVLAGPAPRPLDVLPSKVTGDRLFVTFMEFKAGTSRKEAI